MEKNDLFQRESGKIIQKRLKSFGEGYRQNLALLSDTRDQSFYLLNRYAFAEKIENLAYVYIDASYIEGKEFFRNIATSILSEYLSTTQTLDNLINLSADLLPATTAFIKKNLREKGDASFNDALELLNKFINESSKRCVLIIEEFTHLKNFFKNFHQDFSQFIIFQKKCMLIVSSSQVEKAQRILSNELNFLFGNFETVYLNNTNFLENYLCLKSYLGGISPTPFFVSFFVNILGNNIRNYKLMSEHILKEYGFNESDSIKNILHSSLYQRNSYFYQEFRTRIDSLKNRFKDYVLFLRILLSISNGYIRKNEIISLGICEPSNLKLKLGKLTELGFLSKHSDVYQLKDSLFSFWLSHVFCFNFYPMVLDPKKRLSVFDNKLNESIDLFKDSFYKDKTKRMIELIALFNNDSILIGKSRVKLPFVENAKLISYPERNTSFLIGEGKEIVLAGIKEGFTDDIDVLDYLEKTQTLKKKNVKRFFITLDKFSSSAKFIAKENKLVTWDIDEVNSLLRIYGKPVMINENISNF